MSPYRRGNLYLNIGAIVGELISNYFLSLLVFGVYAVTAPLVFGVGLAHGLSVTVLAFLMWFRSGALLNPAVTFAKVICWATGLHSRDYFGAPTWLSDPLFGLLYLAAQLGGPLLGLLTLRFLDTLDLLPAIVRTTPNTQVDGLPGSAFLLQWLLSLCMVWVWMVVSGPRTGVSIKMIAGSIVIGFVVFGVTVVSVYWGTGSFMHFGLDLAAAVVVRGAGVNTLWLTLLAHMAGAITAVVPVWLGLWLDRLLEIKLHHGTGDSDHVRLSLFRQAFNTMGIVDGEPLKHLFDVDQPPAGRLHTIHAEPNF